MDRDSKMVVSYSAVRDRNYISITTADERTHQIPWVVTSVPAEHKMKEAGFLLPSDGLDDQEFWEKCVVGAMQATLEERFVADAKGNSILSAGWEGRAAKQCFDIADAMLAEKKRRQKIVS